LYDLNNDGKIDDEDMTEKVIDALIALIEPDNLPWQLFFGTQRAADLLHLKERRAIQ